jgi:hypothetical protein
MDSLYRLGQRLRFSGASLFYYIALLEDGIRKSTRFGRTVGRDSHRVGLWESTTETGG